MRLYFQFILSTLLAGFIFSTASVAGDPGSTKSRLAGHWVSDLAALNIQNKKEGHPLEDSAGGALSFGAAKVTSTYEGEAEASPFYVAKDTIWQGMLCRRGEFYLTELTSKHSDANGTVIVMIEDGDTMCHTIESLTVDKLVT